MKLEGNLSLKCHFCHRSKLWWCISWFFFSVCGYLSYFHFHTYLRYVGWIWKIWFAAWVERIAKLILCFYFIFLQSCRPWDRSWRVCKYDLLPWIFWKLIFSTGKLLCDSNSDCGKINPVGNGFEGSSVIIPLCSRAWSVSARGADKEQDLLARRDSGTGVRVWVDTEWALTQSWHWFNDHLPV